MSQFAFNFVITLASVINALGIVRWLTEISSYLRNRSSVQLEPSWTFSLLAVHQLVLHILLWWLFWSARDASTFNFLSYLFLLIGPVLLYLSSSLLAPEIKEGVIELDGHFSNVRISYCTIVASLWVWAIFVQPVLRSELAAGTPIFVLYLIVAVSLRLTANERIHGVLAIANWLLFMVFLILFGLELGGVDAQAR